MNTPYGTQHQPTEIRLVRETKCLEVDFDSGETFSLPAELLRVESPSAEVQGHGPSQKVIVGGKREVAIIGIDAVGNYAVRLRFDDLHDTGIYSWEFLYDMGKRQAEIWEKYLADLAREGLSRDR
ncbi:MAG: gamma-butyrobetaine hydroxylase-like domain-containing protein [Magnetospiraceae bacterium]